MNRQLAVDEDGPSPCAYRLHCRTTWTADSPKISCRLHKVRSTNTAVLVEIVLQQQEIAIALQRVVYAPGNLPVVKQQRAVCASTGRAVWLIPRGVSGCVRLISKASSRIGLKKALTSIVECESDRVGSKPIASEEVELQVCGNGIPDVWARPIGCGRGALFQYRSSLVCVAAPGRSCSCAERNRGRQENAGFHVGDGEKRFADVVLR
jgi:hypothetical protein